MSPERLLNFVRVLLGTVYLVNGTNWFFKIITPYPSMSDYVHFMPPPDVVGAMIEQGVLFHAAKAMEVIAGVLLLSNRFVPLALVVSMSVTVPVFIVDVFKPEFRVRAFLMGSGSLVMNLTLLMAYFDHYRAMMTQRGVLNPDPATPQAVQGDAVSQGTAALCRALLPLAAPVSALLGLVMVGWLALMIGQYVADPKAMYEVRPLKPRPGYVASATPA